MSTDNASWQRFVQVQVDWRAAALVVLFAIVIGGALATRPWLVEGGAQSLTTSTSSTQQAAGGVAWALGEAIFAAVLLGAIICWRRLPEWLSSIIKSSLTLTIWMVIGAWAAFTGAFGLAVLGCVWLYIMAKLADEFDLWWVVNDLLAIGLAVYIGAAAGVVLGPVIVGVGLVGLSVYDYVFADRQTWMFTLGGWTVRNKIPALLVVPNTVRLDWDDIADALTGDGDDELPIGFGIGMADLALPAAFAVALAHGGGGLPLYGAIAGVLAACFRISAKMADGGGAGLPPLTTGALGGWAVAAVVVVIA